MRLISLRWMAILVILFPGLAMAQYGYVPECAETVARQMNISTLDVTAQLGPFTPNRNRIVNWRTQRGRDRSGYCEFNTATGELVRAVSGEYNGPTRNGRYARGAGQMGQQAQNGQQQGQQQGQQGQQGQMGQMGQAGGMMSQPVVNAPSVKVDTAGRGDFNSPGKSVRITRGWVDTQGPRTTIALSGEDHFKINFYGQIVQQNGDREFTMQINGSDRGNATGTATFQLNHDRNEVAYISVTGRLNGSSFNGNFRR